ncbi:NCS1 family nucleobase:cation symporter-1 [Mycobacterium frederiksbergense]|uniref:NCS1 family nucleobase:cation symporter-1 n=1 Tax=Mycolicibacterium frederiksbergense TaxID=117567 RepID=A0ABT6L688_9MYCO|nr:cytosine permease [Mycolicibacterium frederiksbergense]MDH6198423.1 NCS1 family nucleobase:cation symporter-1 [Mycolicibacterium frederiksbergense]
MPHDSGSRVEYLTIQPVPESQRTGKVRHLFSFWFTVQIIPLAVVTGLLGPTIYKLDVVSTIVAIVIGSTVGAVFMALHSVQGSGLGVPQMIQARAQFGMYGSLLVIVVVVLAYVGWIVSLMILAQQTLVAVFPSLNDLVALALSTLLTLTAVVVGYQLILRMNRVMVWLSGLALVLTLGYTAVALAHGGTGGDGGGGAFNWIGFLGMASVAGIWQLSYAPYVSDYSRYLPTATTSRSAFWYTYFGTLLGAVGAMIVGALLVAGLGSDASLASLSSIIPGPLFVFVMLVFFFGAIDAGVINMYGSSLCILTCIQAFKLKWSPKSSARNITATVIAVVVFVAAVGFSDDFLVQYSNFISILIYLLIPWSIVNLIDYYVVKKGHYDPASFSDPKSGYGAFNVPAVLSYFLGFVVQIPFMSTAFYQGAVASKIGGIDTAWIVGTVATFFIYLGLIKLWNQRAVAVTTPAAAEVAQ